MWVTPPFPWTACLSRPVFRGERLGGGTPLKISVHHQPFGGLGFPPWECQGGLRGWAQNPHWAFCPRPPLPPAFLSPLVERVKEQGLRSPQAAPASNQGSPLHGPGFSYG